MNIVLLATMIRDAMAQYLINNPNERSQNKVINAGVAAGMKYCKGHENPERIWWLANSETTVYPADCALIKEGLLRC